MIITTIVVNNYIYNSNNKEKLLLIFTKPDNKLGSKTNIKGPPLSTGHHQRYPKVTPSSTLPIIISKLASTLRSEVAGRTGIKK